jgi:hypothetical protein
LFKADSLGCVSFQVVASPLKDSWQLMLVDWGYNTLAERQAAAQHPLIELVGLEQFEQLLIPADLA